MGSIDRVLGYVMGQPWAILPSRATAIVDVLWRRSFFGKLTPDDVQAAVGADVEAIEARRASAASMGRSQGVAVLPLYGILAHRAYAVENVSGKGDTSTERFAATFESVLANQDVGTVVLDIDSPGGEVSGVEELGALIATSPKPVVAQVNSKAASAAYWLASQANEIAVTPSGEVGSIGVMAIHQDASKKLEAEGVMPTLVTAGENKGLGNPFGPLSEEAREDLQAHVDRYNATFVRDVASGRGVTPAHVNANFGQGLMFGAKEAVRLGMADRVATLQETVDRLASGGRVKRRKGAAAEGDPIAPLSVTIPVAVSLEIASPDDDYDLALRERELAM